MYTFDPDFNILTRFCFFYVVNHSYKKDFPFVYNYVDPSEKEGLIFDKRRLVPRCAESLRDVPLEYLPAFYQGFTNEDPIMTVISSGLKDSARISELVYQFCEKSAEMPGEPETLFVTDELLKPMAETLFKEFGQRSYNAVIKSIKILDDDQTKRCLDYLVNKEFSAKNDNFK
jgi:5-methylcytosine-specific restriction endonuclease McrBC GTP-binding regulatory subunit McrB